MSFRIASLVALTGVLAGVSACSASVSRPAQAQGALAECKGGSVRSAGDAARYLGCDAVAGDLRIERTALTDLNAFANIQRVSGALVIADNAELGDISALQSLTSSSSITIANNPELRSLSGLDGLTRLDSLVLRNNGLYSTRGLGGLHQVGELIITHNHSLISLGGLDHLARAKSVLIGANQRLCARPGFLPRLTRVEGELTFTANTGLFEGDLARVRHQAKAGQYSAMSR